MRGMARWWTVGSFALAVGLVASTSSGDSTGFELPRRPYTVDRAGLGFEALPGAKAKTGITANGSGYRLEMPERWNRDLVVWIRGGAQYPRERLCDPETHEDCTLPDAGYPTIRRHLIEDGFAWASPTFRDYRITPKVRALDVLEAVDRIRASFPDLDRVFIVGRSLGGQTVQHALELFPEAFAGGVAACTGDAAGYTDFYQFTLAALALAREAAPEVAAFLESMNFPVDTKRLAEVAPMAIAALGADFPYERNARGDALIRIIRDLSGGERPMFDAGFFSVGLDAIPGFIIRMAAVDSGTRSFIDNTRTEYRWETRRGQEMTPAEKALNQAIPRFGCHPDVCTSKIIERGQTRNLGGVHQLTGKLQAPLLQINALGDMIAFYSGVQRYAAAAAASGSAHLLVQRAIRDESHCGFKQAEMIEAFDDLVKWVDTGKRPEGDETLDPGVVAAPDYGCQFTRGAHVRDWTYDQVCRD